MSQRNEFGNRHIWCWYWVHERKIKWRSASHTFQNLLHMRSKIESISFASTLFKQLLVSNLVCRQNDRCVFMCGWAGSIIPMAIYLSIVHRNTTYFLVIQCNAMQCIFISFRLLYKYARDITMGNIMITYTRLYGMHSNPTFPKYVRRKVI